MTNDRLRAHREAMRSPSGSMASMSRRELAEAINEYLRVTTGRAGTLSREQVWRWERGLTRWPGKAYREALRAVLGAESDADLGFVRTPRAPRAVDAHASAPVEFGEPSLSRAPHTLGTRRELTVRALIRSQGQVLVVRDEESGWWSLPGGQVGEGMSVQGSLLHHVVRQTGLQATVAGFAGEVEHHGAQPDVRRHAITLVFEVRITSHNTTGEDITTTSWLTVADLARHDVQPVALRDALMERADGPLWRAWTS